MAVKLVLMLTILLMGTSLSSATKCTSDSGCPENQFCEGRGITKRCEECFDCAKVQRNSKRSSDVSNTCARSYHECGECNHGYQELGGGCLPVVTTTTPSPSFRLSDEMKMGPYNREQDDDSKVNKAGLGTWHFVGLGIVTIALVSVCIGVVYKLNGRCNARLPLKVGRKRSRRGSESEEASRLTYCSFNGLNGPYSELARPTAPPPECTQNPPPTNPEYHRLFHEVVNNEGQRANRFDWDDRDRRWVPHGQDAPVVDDQIHPQMNFPAQHNGNVGNNAIPTPGPGDVVDGGASGQLINNIPTGVAHSRMISGNNTPVPPGQSSLSTDAFPPQQNDDPRVGLIDFRFMFRAHIGQPQMASTPDHSTQANNGARSVLSAQANNGARTVLSTQGNNGARAMPTQANNGARTVVSAPASPRRIDDTHVDLTNLYPRFEASNISLDSGTGTNEENDRSVPSRSVSGSDVRELSDVEHDSMYDDESSQMSPAQQPQSDFDVIPEVPDFIPEHMDIDFEEVEE